MPHERPTVSIGLPVYNGERYLVHALESLLGQSFEDFEIVISDNCSTDRTAEICLEHASRDKRIVYHQNEQNIGISANHNLVFELSRGIFFKWAAHDDMYDRDFVRRCVEVMQLAPPSVSVVYTHCDVIDEFGRLCDFESDTVALDSPSAARRLWHYLSNLRRYDVTYGLIRAELLRRTRLFGLFPVSDKVLFAELAMLGTFVEIPEPLFHRRIHPQTSLRAHRTTRERRLLFNPSLAGKWLIPPITGRVEFELLRSSVLIPPTLSDRVGCALIAMLQPPLATVRNFVGRYRRELIRVLAR
jgi:glycosyltransferase involved in cell wall biosynthesis